MPFNVCGSMDLNTELPSAWRVGADSVLGGVCVLPQGRDIAGADIERHVGASRVAVLWSTELEGLNEILEDDYGSGIMLMIYLPL